MSSSSKPIGIIANPSSGRDIRRLVASGTVVSNGEKINTIRRILLGLDALGVENAVIMRDCSSLGAQAMRNLDLKLNVDFLAMTATNCQQDSIQAASLMHEMGVAAIIVLGGDGTNRVVVKGCSNTPLLPISTGTNNAFCDMVEGTLVGIGAAALALGIVDVDSVTEQMPVLEVWNGPHLQDIALVDLVVSSMEHIGTRAIWDEHAIEEVFLTRSEAGTIGFSSIGWHLAPLSAQDPRGLHIMLGDGRITVKAPIAPGLIRDIPVRDYQLLVPEKPVSITPRQGVIALDGEREHMMTEADDISIRYNPCGPRVVNLDQALQAATGSDAFIRQASLPVT